MCPMYLMMLRMFLGIIHLVRTQNFPKNEHLLSPDTHMYVYVSGDKNVSFSENFAYVLNE